MRPSVFVAVNATAYIPAASALKSVESALLSQQYARLRIGVGPLPEGVSDWSEYVLAPFTPEQREQVEAIMPQLVDALTKWVKEGTS